MTFACNAAFRMFEGGRALLKFDLPVSYSEVNGARAVTAQLAVGLEVPVIDQKWSLEPRVGYGITGSDQLGSVGHILSTSVASRFVLRNVGRGNVVIGNMVGYTQTLEYGLYWIQPEPRTEKLGVPQWRSLCFTPENACHGAWGFDPDKLHLHQICRG